MKICTCGCDKPARWKVSSLDYNPKTGKCDIPFTTYACDAAKSYLTESGYLCGVESKIERLDQGE